ncbi:MAG TPA: hypothetical protein VK589_25025 [Chryseolinea sp.]|nr:hypothetical protein [Chryseolinea sp.]
MKFLFVSTLLLLVAQFSVSQDCTKEQLRQKPGTWKAGLKGSINDVKTADLAKERTVLAGIHKMISASYKPTGCEIQYSNVFGKSSVEGQNWIADPYQYSMYVLRYLCDQQSTDKSKSYVDYATPTTVKIIANAMYWLNSLYASNLEPNDFRGYLKLIERPVKKDGYYFMGEEKVDYNSPIYEYRWLITYDDILPFSYVSRKEYLLIQKKRLEKALKENPGDKTFLDQYFKNISNALASPESELSKPAICSWNDEERFEKFVEEGTKGSFIAVVPNLAYYRKNLPLSSPQFFTVVYKISKGDPVFEDNISNIEKAVDFATLKSMLGK